MTDKNLPIVHAKTRNTYLKIIVNFDLEQVDPNPNIKDKNDMVISIEMTRFLIMDQFYQGVKY